MKYIDSTDLPSDPNGSLANLRRELRIAYNSNRLHADKLNLLKETLSFVLSHIDTDKQDETKSRVDSPECNATGVDTVSNVDTKQSVNLTRTKHGSSKRKSSKAGESS